MRKIIRRAAAVLLSAALLLTGTASAAAQIDPVEERLAAMSLREKVGQLFVVRVEALDTSGQSDSTRLTWAERQGLKKYPVGGIVVFRQNVKSPEQLKKLLADFQAASGTGLLTAVDEEGGSVARLANASGFDLPQYQSAQAVGATGDPANARAMGQTIGGYLKTYGLNLDFAPVADVNTNPANTVIGNRAFSSDPAVAAQMVASAVQGFHDAGILCTLLHCNVGNRDKRAYICGSASWVLPMMLSHIYQLRSLGTCPYGSLHNRLRLTYKSYNSTIGCSTWIYI